MSRQLLGNRARSRLRHHLSLMIVAGCSTIALYMLGLQKTSIANLSLATGYVSMALLLVALCIGPVRVLQGRNSPPSIDFRRDISIWCAGTGVIHSLLGLQVHFNGKMHLYFLFPAEWNRFFPIRYDAFGLTNYAGLFAALLLCYLLFLSNDASVRRLGVKVWKRRQRLAYVAAALIGVHTVIYQLIESRERALTALVVSLSLTVVVIQMSGRKVKLTNAAARKAQS